MSASKIMKTSPVAFENPRRTASPLPLPSWVKTLISFSGRPAATRWHSSSVSSLEWPSTQISYVWYHIEGSRCAICLMLPDSLRQGQITETRGLESKDSKPTGLATIQLVRHIQRKPGRCAQ
jgi:hypothetical protein